MRKQDNSFNWGLVVLVIAFVIVLYLLSLGNFNGSYFRSRYDELSESLANAKSRHKKLESLISKKHNLKKKLRKRFKLTYFFVRFLLVSIWGIALFGLFKLGWVINLGDAMNYSNVFVLLLITLNFLTFGNLTNMNAFLDSLKVRIENWVYGKYVSINVIIEVDNLKLVENKKGIEFIQEEIKNINELPAKE
jgi:hypothetical protein